MNKPMTPQQRLEQQEIARKYSDLKGMRERLISEKMIEIEAEMEQARAEYGEFLQHLYERENSPYRWTISALAVAMGTPSGRQTVKKYLGEATSRRKNRFLDSFESGFSGLSILAKTSFMGALETRFHVVAVRDDADGTVWRAVVSGSQRKYTIARVDPNALDVMAEDAAIRDEYFAKEYKRPVEDNAPNWLLWLDGEKEWLDYIE